MAITREYKVDRNCLSRLFSKNKSVDSVKVIDLLLNSLDKKDEINKIISLLSHDDIKLILEKLKDFTVTQQQQSKEVHNKLNNPFLKHHVSEFQKYLQAEGDLSDEIPKLVGQLGLGDFVNNNRSLLLKYTALESLLVEYKKRLSDLEILNKLLTENAVSADSFLSLDNVNRL